MSENVAPKGEVRKFLGDTGKFLGGFLARNLPPFALGVLSRLLLFAMLAAQHHIPLGLKVENFRFFRYDALWHWDIMFNGYGGAAGGNTLVSHYSIVWPMIMRLVSLLTGPDRLSLMFFNCLVFGAACAAVARMARAANILWWKPVVFLCCFPTAYFANSIYNEPIFMFLTAASMAAILEKRLVSGGVWAALGVTIRVNAWAQVVGWLAGCWPLWKNRRKVVLGGLFVLACASVQPLATWYWRGTPFAQYNDLERVGWMASPQMIPFKEPFDTCRRFFREPAWTFANDAFMFHRGWGAFAIIVGIVVLAWTWKKLPWPVRVQGSLTILGLGMLEQAISLPRYMMAFLPFYFWAGRMPVWFLGFLCAMMFWAQKFLAVRFIQGWWAF